MSQDFTGFSIPPALGLGPWDQVAGVFYLGMIRLGMAGWPPALLPVSGGRVAVAGLLLSGLGLPAALALPYPAVSQQMTNPWAHRWAQEVISYSCLPVGEAGRQLSGPHIDFLGWTPDRLGGFSTF